MHKKEDIKKHKKVIKTLEKNLTNVGKNWKKVWKKWKKLEGQIEHYLRPKVICGQKLCKSSLLGGWVDGGSKNHSKDCLQQLNFLGVYAQA